MVEKDFKYIAQLINDCVLLSIEIQKISGKKMKDFNKHLVNFDTQIQEIKNNVIKFATKFNLYV